MNDIKYGIYVVSFGNKGERFGKKVASKFPPSTTLRINMGG